MINNGILNVTEPLNTHTQILKIQVIKASPTGGPPLLHFGLRRINHWSEAYSVPKKPDG